MDNFAVQVRFYDKENGMIRAGILCDDKIICGCCGKIYDVDFELIKTLVKYDNWMDLTETIIGN